MKKNALVFLLITAHVRIESHSSMVRTVTSHSMVISCHSCCVCVSVYPFLPFFYMVILHFLLFFFSLSLPCDFSPQEDILILSVCFSRLLLFSWILTYQFLPSIFCPHSLSLPLLSSHRLNLVSWCHLSPIERRPRGPETPLSLWKPQRELDSALRQNVLWKEELRPERQLKAADCTYKPGGQNGPHAR